MIIPDTDEIRIEPATVCGYACVMCPREELTRPKKVMDWDTYKICIDKLSKYPQFTKLMFAGFGEPWLDQGLLDKMRYARKLGYEVMNITTGVYLDWDKLQAMEDMQVKSIRVSLYGTTNEVYMKVHGNKNKNDFSRIVDLLTKWSEDKRNLEIIISYLVEPGVNDHQLQEWIDYWKDRVEVLEAWIPHNWVTGREYRDIQQDLKPSCGRPFNGPIQVQYDGTINMCCFDFDGKLTFGDLKTHTLEEIFSSVEFYNIKESHETGDYSGKNLICETCDQRNKNKEDILIYNSKFNKNERINMVSSGYGLLEK